MNKHKISFAAFFAASTLAWMVGPRAAIAQESSDPKNSKPLHRPESNLRRDEINFAGDIRSLRRDLRRAVNGPKITEDRIVVREDWRNIVLDRDPHEMEPGGSMTELARSKRLGHFSSDVHRAQTNCGACS